MTTKWTVKYGLAAVLVAVLIITVAMFANPSIIPNQVSAKSSFAVMITDPPAVPSGTTVLNITYSDIALDITTSGGTPQWITVGGSGTIDSFALVNMSKTIASTTIPTNSTVDKIQFTIDNASAVINGETYNVTLLSNTLVLNVANSQVNQTLSGVLIDFNPTLVQIQSVDANGNPVDYYVLVPSATATIVNSIGQDQIKVGAIVGIGQDDRRRVTKVVQNFSQNLAITSASLSVVGNTTSLSVTLQNTGDITFRVFGLMLQGQFSSTLNWQNQFATPGFNQNFASPNMIMNDVPFEINSSSLVPMLGIGSPIMQPMQPSNIVHSPMIGFGRMDPRHSRQPIGPQNGIYDAISGAATPTYLMLQPGQTATLTFSGVISLQPGGIFSQNPVSVTTPTVGNSYTIELMGEGATTFTVTATA